MPSYEYEYDYDDDDDDNNNNNADTNALELISNLDPSVAALVQAPLVETPTKELRVRIAHMKMQQSRIRGNSDYAAKIMDLAIEEGAKDRQAWTLLDDTIRKIERHIATMEEQEAAAAANTTTTTTTTTSETPAQQEDNQAAVEESQPPSDNPDNPDGAEVVDAAEVARLKQELSEWQETSNSLEKILEERLLEEIAGIKVEQSSIRAREAALRTRIRSVQLTLKNLPSSTVNKNTNGSSSQQQQQQQQQQQRLHDALKDVYDYTALLHAECTVCHSNTATRAVIPCGHLALCEECTKTITKMEEPSQRQCPLCRGNLLSTLHIYTTR